MYSRAVARSLRTQANSIRGSQIMDQLIFKEPGVLPEDSGVKISLFGVFNELFNILINISF